MTTRIERLRVGPLGENVYAVQSGERGFLVDPGDNADAILKFISEKEMDIFLIVLTHGHLDHTAAIPQLREKWAGEFPPLAIHPLDACYLGAKGEETNKALFVSIGAPGFFRSYWRPLPEASILLADGDFVPGTNFKVLHTPGHSAGSISLYDAEANALISGDTLFRDGVGRTDGPDCDPGALDSSLARLSKLPSETIVYPGHGPRTTIGRELPY